MAVSTTKVLPKDRSAVPELFDGDTLGQRFSLHPQTLRRAVGRGELRAFKLGGAIRYRVDDVLAWMDSNALGKR